MYFCTICGDKIKSKNLKGVFQFTLGDTINGQFCGNKTFYFHMDCLNSNKVSK